MVALFDVPFDIMAFEVKVGGRRKEAVLCLPASKISNDPTAIQVPRYFDMAGPRGGNVHSKVRTSCTGTDPDSVNSRVWCPLTA